MAFLTRLGRLAQTGVISANRRLQIVRHVRTVLRDARDLGMTRRGGCAAALPGEFSVRADDVHRRSMSTVPAGRCPTK
ncbi:hypothetical protein ACFPJ1_43045 [Kribbella qitaiheensis]|uniref:hypothetical protein n=1 Tax=Kribbella qitaiheensis TaxID=1544730 RepID=UPI003612216C